MSTLTFNGTVVDYGTSVTDLVVNAATATNSVYTVSTVAGAAYYRNVTVNYGYTLKIPRTADFRVNTKLINTGIITFGEAASGTSPGTTGNSATYGGAGGGGGGGYSAGGTAAYYSDTGSYYGFGGSANESYLTGSITSYTSTIPAANGTGSDGAAGQDGSGPNTTGSSGPFSGGSRGLGGGAIKIIAKIFENNGIVDVRGTNGTKGGSSQNRKGNGGGGGGGGGGGSIWFVGDQLIGYGNFYATGGSGGAGGDQDSSTEPDATGNSGLPGGAGGSGSIRLDIGTKSSYIGFFYPNDTTYFKVTLISYIPDASSSGTSIVNAPVYTFGSSSTENNIITNKIFQSSVTKVINTNETFTKALSPYYYNTLIIGANYTLSLEDGVVIYCKKLQIDTGGVLSAATVSGGDGGGGSAGGVPKEMDKGSGGGGGGFAITGGNGTQENGSAGVGGSTYNGFTSLSNPMTYDFSSVSSFSLYRGSSGGSGARAESRYTVTRSNEEGGNYEEIDHGSDGGGGGYGRGFNKIFAWETIIDGIWDARGKNGTNGGPQDYNKYGGGGGGGSGGGIHLVTGKLTSTSGSTGIIDIRGGTQGYAASGASGHGGAGSSGRAYVWCNSTTFTAATNFYGSSHVTFDTGNLVTSTVDSAVPIGNISLYSKTIASSLYNADNEKIFGLQSLVKTLRPKEWFTIAHSLNEFDFNYVGKIQKNSLAPVTLSSFSTYTKLGALKALTKVLVTSNSTTGLLLETTLPYNTTVTTEPSNVTLGTNIASTFGGVFANNSNSDVIVNSIQFNPMSYANIVNLSIIHIVQTNTPYRLYSWYMSGSNLVTSVNQLLGTASGSAIVGDSGHTVASMVIDPAGNNIFILYNKGVGVLGTTVNYIRSMKFKGWIAGNDFGYTHNSHAAYATGASVVVGATTAITGGGGYPVAPGLNFSIARCMAIHPSGSYLYVASCATSSDFGKTTVQRFSVDQTTGLITLLSNSTELVNNTLIGTYPVSMFCDPTGKWLYVSCSSTLDGTQSSLAAYLVQNGTIVAKEETFFSETGKPSCFAFDLTGSFIHLGYGTDTSNWIRTFKINQSTGGLTEVLPVASTDYTYGSLKRIIVDPTSSSANAFIYVIGNNSASSNLYVTCFSRNTTTGEVKFVNKSFFDFAANTNGGDTTMDIEPRRSATDTAAGLFPRILAGTTYNKRNAKSSFRLYTQSGSDPYYQQQYNEEKYSFESNVSGLVKVWPAIQAPFTGSLTVNFSSSDYYGNSGDNTSSLALNIIPFASPLSF